MNEVNVALSVLAVGGITVAGVYVTGAMDEIVGRVVARRPLRVAQALAAPVRSAAAMLLQGRTTTERPDAPAWAVAPALLAAAAAVSLTAIPLARGLAVADVPDGVALYGAAIAMVIVAVFLHGWSPNSPFPLLGAYRFVAEGLSYPIPLLLTLISTALAAKSLSVGAIVSSQSGLWNVVRQPLGLPLFLVTGWGLAFWGPLAFADAADLGGGTELESAGPALLVWRAARAAVLVSVAAMGAAAFLGGWMGPLLPGALWMLIKTSALLAALVAGGHAFGRVPVERFVTIAWAILIPLALVDVFVSGAIAL